MAPDYFLTCTSIKIFPHTSTTSFNAIFSTLSLSGRLEISHVLLIDQISMDCNFEMHTKHSVNKATYLMKKSLLQNKRTVIGGNGNLKVVSFNCN
mmetsp:Transcript_61832/g.126085  ORF Transcript_61832/g.126085 Transcript_61832/m.126085 type:complete len:95 (-) Transcript_61832:27-311(-)